MTCKLSILPGKSYFARDGKPFFWLGDTAWLLFSRMTDEEAFTYLQNRSEKGFNVIQATLIHFWDKPVKVCGDPRKLYFETEEYWQHCDRIIDKAAELGLTMALLPSWGGIVRSGHLNLENADNYTDFLIRRYADRDNIIWLLGGDVKGEGLEEYYDRMGRRFKAAQPDRLVGYHPFGRCSSSLWFNDAEWLDFHMFQSGHRRYDQYTLGAWDDTSNPLGQYLEDNWKFVVHDRALSSRPVLDGEPSYEGIHQGLHDFTQPLWSVHEVRRYAYWSVFAGAAGHTYGHNSIMQFYDSKSGFPGAFNASVDWFDALDHPGAGQMRYLKELMESVDYTNGHLADELIEGGQREKHERIAVFAGDDYLLCYTFLGKPFALDVRKYRDKEIRLMDPADNSFTPLGKVVSDRFVYRSTAPAGKDPDRVIVIR